MMLGLTFYFNSKNKKLEKHIQNLSQLLEKQEQSIQKHEHMISQLISTINSYRHLNSQLSLQASNIQKPIKRNKKSTRHIQNIHQTQHTPPLIKEEQNDDHDDSDDLDDEMEEELKELEDSEDNS